MASSEQELGSVPPAPVAVTGAVSRDAVSRYWQPDWMPFVVCRLAFEPGGQFALTPSNEDVLPFV